MLHIATVRKHLRMVERGDKLVIHPDILQQHLDEAKRQGLDVTYKRHDHPFYYVLMLDDKKRSSANTLDRDQ